MKPSYSMTIATNTPGCTSFCLMQTLSFATRFEYFESIDSTNAELRRRFLAAPQDWPDFSVIAAAEQTAGRGRLDRGWVSEPGTSLAMSVLLRPSVDALPWLSLTAGLAIAAAVRKLSPDAALTIKWPNDVLLAGKKLSGTLAEIVAPDAVVLGIGINLRPQLHAPETATALSEHGIELDFGRLANMVLATLRPRYLQLDTDPGRVALRQELLSQLGTLGQRVRAELPDGTAIEGLAKDIDNQGRLVILSPEPRVLAAADVWHLRN
jgi:BirA family transcriptional regulator, biotin operon repressor / biotin---[acetyl-CoA-carboxylase] ligase